MFGSVQSVVCLLVLVILYIAMSLLVLWALPCSFTAGETIIVTKALSLVLFDTAMVTMMNLNVIRMPSFLVASRSQFVLLLEVIISWMFLLITLYAPICIKARMAEDAASKRKWSLYFYEAAAGAGVLLLAGWLSTLLKANAFYWAVTFIQSKLHKTGLVLSWICCVAASLRVVTWRRQESPNNSQDKLPRIIIRKSFHFIASIVFITGLVGDTTLLHVACTVALASFILVEVIRSYRLWPAGDILHDYMSCLIDDRDSGRVILTHIYLLVGLAIPVWLIPNTNGAFKIAMYSGVLSLGIGDSFASIIGKQLGQIKLPNSEKTLEGTVAGMIGQIVMAGVLYFLDPEIVLRNTTQAICIIVSLVFGSFLEAVTLQIDNLVLPLYTLALLMIH